MARKDDERAAEAAEREEDAQFASMIGDTETEIMNSAFDNPEDENDGDHSLEQMEPALGEEPEEESEGEEEQAEPESETEEGESEPEAGAQQDERQERFVPSGRLREVSERAERLERELAQERQWRLEQSQRQAPQQPPPAPPVPPDMFADPEGFQRHMMQEFERKEHETYVRRSMGQAEDEHGEDFRFARDEILKRRGNPEVEAAADRIFRSANPGRALMQWAEPLLSEFREQQAERVRQQFADMNGISVEDVDRMQAMYARQSGRPVQQRRPANNPPSLNGASGGGNRARERLDPRGMDGSERAIFEDVFRTN